jgi:uncharacterized phiE125 gp8 family phage protein
MSAIAIETQPSVEPITLTETKEFCRVDLSDTSQDLTLNGFMIAARQYCEGFTRRAFITTAFIQYLDWFPFYDYYGNITGYPNSGQSGRYLTSEWNHSQQIKLLRPPLIAVTNIKYTDANGVVQTLTPYDFTTNPTGFYVDAASEPGRLFPAPGLSWPTSLLTVPNCVQIHFTAGYGGDATKVPQTLIIAMKQLVAHWFEHRESSTELNLKEAPQAVDTLLWNERVLDYAPTKG